ncbi:C40 family peptidase [Candidatus Pantoea multigeneris]|uniref:Peptidase P60 n=1 Tax=Candidatus Pantoea multigeneris TaxID=2608357 RepID=A0ABX0R587_9GAMM|nr:C40 family peptidase [Pantoea multigeneris]NIF20572.1 peptidase P60 [Pantoea multigeneris]
MRKKVLEAIQQHVAAAYPNEACGVIVQNGRAQQYIPCRNTAEVPTENFTLAPEDFTAAEALGEVLMIIHSHPDVVQLIPSEMDRIQCDWSGVEWGIMSWPDGDFCTLSPRVDRDYTGRPWVIGYADCWSLIKEYYSREFSLALGDYSVPLEWWIDGKEALYDDNWEKEGFAEISTSDLRHGDIIMMRLQSSVTNHAAVYLGENIILHHLSGQLSTRIPYGSYHRDRTVRIVRHKELMNA